MQLEISSSWVQEALWGWRSPMEWTADLPQPQKLSWMQPEVTYGLCLQLVVTSGTTDFPRPHYTSQTELEVVGTIWKWLLIMSERPSKDISRLAQPPDGLARAPGESLWHHDPGLLQISLSADFGIHMGGHGINSPQILGDHCNFMNKSFIWAPTTTLASGKRQLQHIWRCVIYGLKSVIRFWNCILATNISADFWSATSETASFVESKEFTYEFPPDLPSTLSSPFSTYFPTQQAPNPSPWARSGAWTLPSPNWTELTVPWGSLISSLLIFPELCTRQPHLPGNPDAGHAATKHRSGCLVVMGQRADWPRTGWGQQGKSWGDQYPGTHLQVLPPLPCSLEQLQRDGQPFIAAPGHSWGMKCSWATWCSYRGPTRPPLCSHITQPHCVSPEQPILMLTKRICYSEKLIVSNKVSAEMTHQWPDKETTEPGHHSNINHHCVKLNQYFYF